MVPYLDCPHPDQSGITLEYYEDLSKIRFWEDRTSVRLHRHDFYEMVLVLRGSCQHFYRDTYIPLMPGDLLLVPPDRPHAYRFHESISMCNCQFYPQALEHESKQFIADIEYTDLQQKTPPRKRFEDIRAVWADAGNRLPPGHIGNINGQGIIHFGLAEQNYIFGILEQILGEQENQKFGFERIKKMLLETVLIQIKRVQMDQFENMERSYSWQTEMIDAILNRIETNLSDEYDFNAIAEKRNFHQLFPHPLQEPHRPEPAGVPQPCAEPARARAAANHAGADCRDCRGGGHPRPQRLRPYFQEADRLSAKLFQIHIKNARANPA